MLKRVLLASLIGFLSQTGFAAASDQLGIAGNYICSGYDMHDGAYSGGKLTVTLDAKDSDFANNYGAYRIKMLEPDGTTYVGEIAASGNTLALYFEDTGMASDRGVGVAVLTHDKDANGKVTTAFHKFYYEPNYEGGGNGTDACVKQD